MAEIPVRRLRSMVSCKWMICIGILGVIFSIIIGIILGVIAVHFGLALPRVESNATTTSSETALKADAEALEFETDTANETATNERDNQANDSALYAVLNDTRTETTESTGSITFSNESSSEAITPNEQQERESEEVANTIHNVSTPSRITDEARTDSSTTPIPSSTSVSDFSNTSANSPYNFEEEPRVLPKKNSSSSETSLNPNSKSEQLLSALQSSEQESSTTWNPDTSKLVTWTTEEFALETSPVHTNSVQPNDTFATRPFWLESNATTIAPVSETITTDSSILLTLSALESTTNSPTVTESSEVAATEDLEVQEALIRCPSSEKSIRPEEFCDGIVQCPEAADEAKCACVDKIDRSKICDGVFDCPNMEDEIGCRGCDGSRFNCDDTRKTCISLNQRCDGTTDCPDGRDEAGCSILSPSLEPLEVFTPIHSTGFALHYVKGKWLPICSKSNFSDTILGICSDVIGTLSREIPKINKKENDHYNGTYVTSLDGILWSETESCTSLLYVECLEPICGKRGPSSRSSGRKALLSRSLLNPSDFQQDPGHLEQADASSVSEHSSMEEPNVIKLQRYNRDDRPSRFSPIRHRLTPDKRSRRQLFQDRIVGGKTSFPGEWPWMVAVVRDGVLICGGSLISRSHILSAGHCFDKYHSHYYEIQLGMLRRFSFSPYEQTRLVIAVWQHPEYEPLKLRNDIAVLLVEKPFNINQWTAPVCMPPPQFQPTNGTLCSVVGWGNTQELGVDSDSLQQTTVPITPCKRSSSSSESIICAGFPEGGQDACQGDSGGPLNCVNPEDSNSWILTGIVSHGIGCARPEQPGIYTRVSFYSKWIMDIVNSGMNDLPLKRPRTLCDGIICQRGSGACVPRIFVCDKVVDCLHAEDEVNCNSTITTSKPEIKVPIVPTVRPICTSDQFTCTRTAECISSSLKCDMKMDCQDGSDEMNCTCLNYLNKTMICDGHVDCEDFTDEKNCGRCASEEQYYSQVSSECFNNVSICDGIPNTPFGDDEFNCLALTGNDSEIILDHMSKPLRTFSGVVAINRRGNWHAYCTTFWNSSYSDAVCQYIGYGSSIAFNLTNQTIKHLKTNSENILWEPPIEDSVLDDGRTARITTKGLSIVEDLNQARQGLQHQCTNVKVTCSGQPCGFRPRFNGASFLRDTEGQWPWHVSLYRNGSYFCTAALVSHNVSVTIASCFTGVDLLTDYVAAYTGAARLTPFTNPYEQISRVVRVERVPHSQAVLLLLESPVVLNEYVNPICLSSPDDVNRLVKYGYCAAVGPHGDLVLSSVNLNASICNTSLCSRWNQDQATNPAGNWSGIIYCFDGHKWFATAMYQEVFQNLTTNATIAIYDGLWPLQSSIKRHMDIIAVETFTKKKRSIGRRLKALPCAHRCPLGKCLDEKKICDGVPDCRDLSDEQGTCFKAGGQITSKECIEDEFKCTGGACISSEKRCDMRSDCPNGEDEENCTPSTFQCLSNDTDEFVSRKDVCNGISDCSNGRDESLCVALSNTFPINEDSNGDPKANPSGYVYFRYDGEWYLYCYNEWNSKYSNALCKTIGYDHATGTHTRMPASLVELDESYCLKILHLSCV